MPEIEGRGELWKILACNNKWKLTSVPLRKINKNPVYPGRKIFIFGIRVLPVWARMKRVYEPHHRARQRQRISNLIHWTQMLCIISQPIRFRLTWNSRRLFPCVNINWVHNSSTNKELKDNPTKTELISNISSGELLRRWTMCFIQSFRYISYMVNENDRKCLSTPDEMHRLAKVTIS